MSTRYYSDLVRGQTPTGQRAQNQDYQDALRALSDAYARYVQLGDDVGQALAGGMMAALLVTRGQQSPKLVLRRGQVVAEQHPPF
jgi:hypothetical protein